MAKDDLIPVRTKSEAKERGRNGGIKSGQVRRQRAELRKLGYTAIESFDKLNKLQRAAAEKGNITAALKAEELKGKLAGLYIEKVAQTDSMGKDVQSPPVINIQPVKVVTSKHECDLSNN